MIALENGPEGYAILCDCEVPVQDRFKLGRYGAEVAMPVGFCMLQRVACPHSLEYFDAAVPAAVNRCLPLQR